MAMCSLPRFKSLARKGEAIPADTVLRKDVFATVEDMDDRKVRFTISTGAVDRDGDTVSVEGWQLDRFRQNPVVLWGHDAWDLPIGRCVEIGGDGATLKALVEFLPADMPVRGPYAEAVLRMCRTGFLSATSVGFKPLEYEIAKERMDDDAWFAPLDFTKQELMEFSIVSIPCNHEALIDPGERRGLVTPPAGASVEQLAADEAAQKAADTEMARVAIVEAARRARKFNARLIAAA